jgi:ABC-type phosphate/phosphonate transport system substrate-binding protein
MYDFPELREAHDALWAAVADRLIGAGLADVPRHLTLDLDHRAVWGHPRLLLGQACEYPLAKAFAGKVRLVASPCYAAPGCTGARYRSAIIVRADDARPSSLSDLRGLRCAVNEMDSNSGMNLLRAAVARIGGAGRFFSSVTVSGSHRRSVEWVASGMADVAAIDCVTLGHLQRIAAPLIRKVRVLDWTPDSPSLQFITAGSASASAMRELRAALASACDDPGLAEVRDMLLLTGMEFAPCEDFRQVLELEREAIARGFPSIDGLPV